MPAVTPTVEELIRENQELRRRLEEAEAMVSAIREGGVDAFLVRGGQSECVLLLDGADRPYRLLVEQMQQGAVTVSADGMVAYANGRFADMVGVPFDQLLGSNLVEYFAESDRPRIAALLARGPATGEAELTLVRNETPVHVTANPLVAESGIMCLILTDLTQQKRQERERAARAEAERLLHEARAADRRKDEFLAMLAHELRNPLAPVRHAVALLNHFDTADQKLGRACEIIGRQVDHLARLVDDLLEMSRLTQAKVELHVEPVEVATVVSRALETCQPLLDARRHRLTLHVPDGLVVNADSMRLEQILSNLLTNAAKYTDEGGQVRLAAARCDDFIEISVRDTGIGIPKELLPRLFDLFTQGERTLARSEGGLGIGLTLVKRLVELHGGSVVARSEGTGRGSEFIVRLPAATGPVAIRQAPPRPCTTARHRSILIVDDNTDGADSLAMLLGLGGHTVRTAYSGPMALEVARELKPEVALLDIGLPGMDGYELARQLRQLPELARATLIALTGYSQDEDRERSHAAGFDHHLVKPVDLAKLKELLEY